MPPHVSTIVGTPNGFNRDRCVIKNEILFITTGILILGLLGPRRVEAQVEPVPGVARVSVIHGEVFTWRGNSKGRMPATVNAPVERGDNIAIGPGSRTELQLDYADILRLDHGAGIKVVELTRTRIEIQVTAGLADFVVAKGAEAAVEIDTPNMTIRPRSEGTYRIQVISAADTHLTVRRGQAEVATPRGSVNVGWGQLIDVKGRDNPEYRIAPSGGKDEWDGWNDDRDHIIADPQVWQHTNRYYTGSEDLERYGQWVEVPGYDWCWAPYVQAGWAPYRDGRWVADPYYAWTWLSYEPWGWAPYHYGRWIAYGSDWCWWPGMGINGPRPVWGPGFVAFFGFGAGQGGPGSDLGFESIGWLPLGPRDRMSPWWGRGRGFSSTNITDINNIPMTGLNEPDGQAYGSNLQGIMTVAYLQAAITAIPAQSFATGSMAHNLIPLNEDMLRQGSLIQGTLPVTPTKASLPPAARPGNHSATPGASVAVPPGHGEWDRIDSRPPGGWRSLPPSGGGSTHGGPRVEHPTVRERTGAADEYGAGGDVHPPPKVQGNRGAPPGREI